MNLFVMCVWNFKKSKLHDVLPQEEKLTNPSLGSPDNELNKVLPSHYACITGH